MNSAPLYEASSEVTLPTVSPVQKGTGIGLVVVCIQYYYARICARVADSPSHEQKEMPRSLYAVRLFTRFLTIDN